MASIIQYPSYLILRIPTSFCLLEKFELTDTISLWPGARYEPPEKSVKFFLNTILYIEKNPPSEQFGPPTWPRAVSYKNLREFILFWAFLSRERWSISEFECSEVGPILLDKLPDEKPSFWNNNPSPLNPKQFPIKDQFLSLDTAFTLFKAAGSNQDLVALFMHNPNRHVEKIDRIIYNNYLLDASLLWFVIDALLPAKYCGGSTPCPKCGKPTQLSHVCETFRERVELALSGFQHSVQYAQLLDNLRKVRGVFVHNGTIKNFPSIHYSDLNPHTGIRYREVTLEETLEALGTEGLATQSALITARRIVYWLLFNRIFPDLNIWPDIELLKMSTTG